jgi:ubiquinone/menaquinone biosynthesis C-methylase UbiE
MLGPIAARFKHTPLRVPISDGARAVWSAGDYDRIAAGFRHEAEAFVERQGLARGQRVLDAACGSGNATIPAARTGARVTGIDLVPGLLNATATWGQREGLTIRLDQGTVEDLPYDGAQFDVVLSMFGLMFAARPDRVTSELARVTRSGGRVVLANWTRQGFVGRLIATHAAYVPPPAGLPDPLLWGDESVIHERFDRDTWHVVTTVRTLTLRYPYTPMGTAELYRVAYGPTVRTYEALDEDRRALLAADIEDQWVRDQRRGSPMTEVDAEYREVIAIRR